MILVEVSFLLRIAHIGGIRQNLFYQQVVSLIFGVEQYGSQFCLVFDCA